MHPSQRVPLHERISILGRVRASVRRRAFELLQRVAATDDGRGILHGLLPDLHDPPPRLGTQRDVPSPYADLGQATESAPCLRDDVVILTARFRSGSTLFWNLFREIPCCTSFYEPFNERRWFDPEHRQGHTDPTHRGVRDYWREYDGLGGIAELYREEWIDRRLYMGERAWDPEMKAYVEALIAHAPGRPVLQFNRIDFRVPWIRRHFPDATILHLYRHPREAWTSSLMDLSACPPDVRLEAFAESDHFYLLRWVLDLRHSFPLLDPSAHEYAYDLYYLVWKLSYLFGTRYADRCLSYEELSSRPAVVLPELLDSLGIAGAPLDKLVGLVAPPRGGRWRARVGDAWFASREARCERILADFLESPVGPGRSPAPLAGIVPGAGPPGQVPRRDVRSTSSG